MKVQYAGLTKAQKQEKLARLRHDARLPSDPGLSDMKPEEQVAWVRAYNEDHAQPHRLLPRQTLADKATYTIDERRDGKAKRLQVMQAQAACLAARDAELVAAVDTEAAVMHMAGVDFSADEPVDTDTAKFVDDYGEPLGFKERAAVVAKLGNFLETGRLVLMDGEAPKKRGKKSKPEDSESTDQGDSPQP
jgi:hypothetical protein